MVVPPIFTEELCEKLSDSFIQDIYMRCWMNLTEDPINISVLQFVDLGLSTMNAMDKGTSIWTPATRVGRPTYVSHWRALDHIFLEKIQRLETL